MSTPTISPSVSESLRQAAGGDRLPLTVIEPRRGWRLLNLAELWRYRELVYYLMWRDVKVRYKQTVLGVAWAILQPFLMMVVLTLVMGRMAGVDTGSHPQPVFFFSGILLWQFFATAISAAANSVVQSDALVTKVYFPRLAIPLASIGAALIDFLIAFGMLLLLMAYYRVVPTWGLLLVPILVFLVILAASGVGTLLAALNVSYRDFRYTLPFLVQIWMFATPSIYMDLSAFEARASGGGAVAATELTPHDDAAPSQHGMLRSLAGWLSLNPMTGLIAAFRAAMLGDLISWWSLGYASTVIGGMFVVGCLYFRRVENTFADNI